MAGASKRALNKIKENRERKLSGKYNSIPFGLKKLEQHVPGIQKPNIAIITANSGVGKSKLAKNMFVFKPYDFVKTHKKADVKFTVLYFCLEEPDEAWIQSYICFLLKEKYDQRISIKELKSQLNPDDPTSVIDPTTLDRVMKLEPYLEEFEKDIHLITGVNKPYAIYKHCTDFLEGEGIGDWKLGPQKIWSPKEKKMVTRLGKERFIYDHQDHYVLIVIDHISLLHPEKGQDLWGAINALSSIHMLNLRNTYGCSVLMVQQQSSDKEKQQYTYKGASIESKLEPSLDGLGDNKTTQRDADEVFGLFAPDRYEIADHRGYDITQLRDNYRSLSILKSRDGEANLRLGMFFDGASNQFKELPSAKTMTKAHYEKVLKMTDRA